MIRGLGVAVMSSTRPLSDAENSIARLHEVATERTVQLAAVIEKAFQILDQNTEAGGGVWVMARDAHAVLAAVDTDAVLREHDREVAAKAVEACAEEFRAMKAMSRDVIERGHLNGSARALMGRAAAIREDDRGEQ